MPAARGPHQWMLREKRFNTAIDKTVASSQNIRLAEEELQMLQEEMEALKGLVPEELQEARVEEMAERVISDLASKIRQARSGIAFDPELARQIRADVERVSQLAAILQRVEIDRRKKKTAR